MKIESSQSREDKAKWKIVRLDSFTDVQGELVSADEDTGEFSVVVPNADRSGTETKTVTLGPGGIRIVGRK